MMIAPEYQPDIPPNQTLYLSNLNEKVRLDDLKRALYDAFSQFGPILDIVAQRNLRMKGQAFVVFQELNHSVIAQKAMQGFIFFNKPMRVQFAKTKSDHVAKIDGTYVQREPKPSIQVIHRTKPQAIESQVLRAPKAMDQPNNILFLQNLPEQATLNTLRVLFGQLPGFKEVRMVPNRNDIAFVEYETDSYASTAKESLQGFKITATHPLKINYAKK